MRFTKILPVNKLIVFDFSEPGNFSYWIVLKMLFKEVKGATVLNILKVIINFIRFIFRTILYNAAMEMK